jgi:predicted RecB family nuclease
MKKIHSKIFYSPTDISNFEKCNYITVNDIKNLTTPLEIKETTETLQEFIIQGIEIEKKYIQLLKDQGALLFDGSKVKKEDRLNKTLEAMKEGYEYIYHPLFEYQQWVGEPDLLIKVDKTSEIGSFSYFPADIKRAKEPKQENLTQILTYCFLLEKIQGILPDRFLIINGPENDKHEFALTDYYEAYEQLRQKFEKFVLSNNLTTPDPCKACQFCQYLPTCDSIWSDTHIKNVTGITNRQIKKLKGIAHTVEQLAHLDQTSVEGIGDQTLMKLKSQAILQQEKIETGIAKYIFKKIPEKKGFHRLPEACENDIFFDIEGDPTVDGGHEYLFGYILNNSFCSLWATDIEEEKDQFQTLMEIFKDHILNNPQAHIYHYNHYEVTALKRMTVKYDRCADILDFLLRNNVFVDLYPIVRESLQTSEKGLSIKDLEIFYMENRTALVSSGADSVDMFLKWRTTQESEILHQIEEYNKEDCLSTELLRNWLIERLEEWKNIPENDELNYQHFRQTKYHDFHNEYDAEYAQTHSKVHNQTSIEEKSRMLIADSLEYHSREQKSQWWRFFSKESFDEIEILEDMECIGNLKKTQTKDTIDQSLQEFIYPPQEFKIKEGNTVCNIKGLSTIGTIDHIDMQDNRILIKSSSTLPDSLSITSSGPPGTKNLRAAIYRFAQSCIYQEEKYQCLFQLVSKEKPRFLNNYKLSGLNEENIINETKTAIENLDRSYLFIQGPPGTGKTYITAHAIIHLLRQRKKIAVTSNSHKAINNVLEWVDRIAEEHNFSFEGLKKFSYSSKESKYVSSNISAKTSLKSLPEDLDLFAATGFELSKELYDQEFDYLFIDEAGQQSIPDVIASGTSCKNLILIGDPRQLGRPSDITHPGESGLSALDYILGDFNTVPQDSGVFLAVTRRMRSEIVPFISDNFYDSRLVAHEGTNNRRLIFEDNPLPCSEGIIMITMNHQDNSQSCLEEIAIIEKLYGYFLSQSYDEGGNQRAISINDILVVAPYNVQVNLLQKKLVTNNRTGTIDKFQGQEAPISILSMTSSDVDNSPRGIKFLMQEAKLNVAISRAQCLSIILINEELLNTPVNNIKEIKMKNNFLKLKRYAKVISVNEI